MTGDLAIPEAIRDITDDPFHHSLYRLASLIP